MPTVVLGVTGCIGAYKACEVLRELQKQDVDVHVVMTANATRFVSPMTFEALSRHPVFFDQFALGSEGDIRHISLADAADLLLVAPATANTIGK
ncbi:MAG TPA: flavoprotein, partial [Vicinamibacteria bacterium]|nr:flavoprotein [Vicinamibacteria bacterium]